MYKKIETWEETTFEELEEKTFTSIEYKYVDKNSDEIILRGEDFIFKIISSESTPFPDAKFKMDDSLLALCADKCKLLSTKINRKEIIFNDMGDRDALYTIYLITDMGTIN